MLGLCGNLSFMLLMLIVKHLSHYKVLIIALENLPCCRIFVGGKKFVEDQSRVDF